MSKKDYELLAKRFNADLSYYRMIKDTSKNGIKSHAQSCEIAIMGVINSLATDLQNDNPHFNRAKFLQACGYND